MISKSAASCCCVSDHVLSHPFHQMGFGGGMDESFEDPGTFDDDDDEEHGEIDQGEHLEARHAPDLSGLLSVSPLVRFDHPLRYFFF